MAHNNKMSEASANAMADRLAQLANSGFIRIYDGTQPAGADDPLTTQNQLCELLLGSPAFGAASGGMITANPITPGASISADLVLTGDLCGSGDFFCGNVSGQATSPITLDLDKSTFTMTKVPEGAAPPTRPAIDCSGTQSDPPR